MIDFGKKTHEIHCVFFVFQWICARNRCKYKLILHFYDSTRGRASCGSKENIWLASYQKNKKKLKNLQKNNENLQIQLFR